MLGYPHPDYMLPWLTARQLDDWLAWLSKYYPFPDRNDCFWGRLLAMTHNQWAADKSDMLRPIDFMPYNDPYPEMTPADMWARLGFGK